MTAVRLAGDFQRGEIVTFSVDGELVSGYLGETLAAALLAAGIARLRQSPRDGAPRGAFCFMGVCQECVLRVDGDLRQACQTPVAAGLVVELRGAV